MLAKKLPINKIDQNALSPNEMSPDQHHKLTVNIKRTGQYPSLVVLKQEDRYLLLDGHNRLAILKELGKKEVWCEIWELGKKEADLFLATVNRLRGTDDVHKRVKLIHELYESFDQDRELLLTVLPESERSLNALLKMAEKESDDLEKDLEDERGVIESQLTQMFPEEEATRMANMYKRESDIMKLVFKFDNRESFEKAISFFSEKPDIRLLMELIENAQEK